MTLNASLLRGEAMGRDDLAGSNQTPSCLHALKYTYFNVKFPDPFVGTGNSCLPTCNSTPPPH